MSEVVQSRDAAHFERIYADSADPWNFRSSPYERGKYAATLAALPPRKYRTALEVGCSIGELTRLLAARCDAVHGVDIAAAPLAAAQQRCDDLPHVRFSRMTVPAQWPLGLFDLIMLSEVLYFLAPDDVRALAAKVRAALAPNGVVLLVNWLGAEGDAATGDPATGDEAADAFIAAAAPGLQLDLQQRFEQFRIDRMINPVLRAPMKTR
jgi:cyclopropane fatty-acyl-phospholipid synthase-like methyltransferase